jgi:trigger factor
VAKRGLLDVLDGRWTSTCPRTSWTPRRARSPTSSGTRSTRTSTGHDHAHRAHRGAPPPRPRRVKLGLLLAEIGQKAEVKVTDAELTQAILTQARQYRGQERQFFEYVQNNAGARQQIQAPIYEDKVIDHVFAQAQVEEREVSKDDLQKAVDALDEE